MRLRDFFMQEKAPTPASGAIEGAAPSPHKWLPIIDTDSCTGCHRCVTACEYGCLGMEWDFAVLQHPHQCDSEGACMAACPHEVIKMGWVVMEGSPQIGRWRSPSGPAPAVRACVATPTNATHRAPRPSSDASPAITSADG